MEKEKPHVHIYDSQGRQLCCTQAEKIYIKAGAKELLKHNHGDRHVHGHKVKDTHEHVHSHSLEDKNLFQLFLPAIISFVVLFAALFLDHLIKPDWFNGWMRILWYTLAYIPVGVPVLKEALESIIHGEIFSEFFLMGIATIGAFAIGEYPEGMAVMLFYSIGEVFQTMAVSRAQNSIKSLLDERPDEVTLLKDNEPVIIKAADAATGDIIYLKPGEKLALDGELLSASAIFNTSALTGESMPEIKKNGETVLAGMININSPVTIRVTAIYEESKLSKILALVQEATSQKAPTELFIRKFAKVYTPIVVFLAIAIVVVPALFADNYIFSDWLYRSLIFLVISCPCALVISIPLGYFGGIGAASRKGILFKGGNYLDALAAIKNLVVDKTGTMTKGVFTVESVEIGVEHDAAKILKRVNALEGNSTHPVATAIHQYVGEIDYSIAFEEVEEIAGLGLRGVIDGKELLAGNFKLLERYGVDYFNDSGTDTLNGNTIIAIAFDKTYVGSLSIADSIKPDAIEAVSLLKKMGVNVTMLSGDKESVVKSVALKLGIEQAFGDLLPADKVSKVQEIKRSGESVAFVGDGINDAPVIALSDVGIAMGGLGSDAAIEIADVVIQDDMPSKIATAIKIGKETKKIVWQNILFAFGVKVAVLILGAGGLATMWEAVFADVGVSLIAILNAVRIQRK